MATKTVSVLKARFQDGVEVNEQDYSDIFDSFKPIIGTGGGDAPVSSSGTVIAFDRARIYGKVTPETGNITADETDATEGMVQLLVHNNGTEPTFSAEFKKIGGSYTISVDNYIYFHYVSSGRILYTINQIQ